MTDTIPKPTPEFTDDDWLEQFNRRENAERTAHACGNCRTPYGLSAVPCKNDPAPQR
ncbi:hypothetical protein [Microbacterium oleivorans]|uniref:hypothetical protein n=1 Tax=Microbacterium oleivorans TaxID=273677 RepID=UPI0014045D8A|nr:hypothetical protein [Microbacterium oleivorans]